MARSAGSRTTARLKRTTQEPGRVSPILGRNRPHGEPAQESPTRRRQGAPAAGSEKAPDRGGPPRGTTIAAAEEGEMSEGRIGAMTSGNDRQSNPAEQRRPVSRRASEGNHGQRERVVVSRAHSSSPHRIPGWPTTPTTSTTHPFARTGHRGQASSAPVRTVLSSGSGPLPRHGRHRLGAVDRQAPRRGHGRRGHRREHARPGHDLRVHAAAGRLAAPRGLGRRGLMETPGGCHCSRS